MHHVLWEPRVGARRFFELSAQTWRRSILNLGGQKKWSHWAKQINPLQLPYLTRVLLRTQRMMRPDDDMKEHDIGVRARAIRSNDFLPFMTGKIEAPRADVSGRRDSGDDDRTSFAS